MKKAAINCHMQAFVRVGFQFLLVYPKETQVLELVTAYFFCVWKPVNICPLKWLCHVVSPLAMNKGCFISSQHLMLSVFWILVILIGKQIYRHRYFVLIYIFLVTNNVEHLFSTYSHLCIFFDNCHAFSSLYLLWQDVY